MKPKGNFIVAEFENPNKSTSWRVAGTRLDGQRVRENYPSHAEALARKQELEIEAANHVPDKRYTMTRLTPKQEEEAELAYKTLGEKSLMLAVRYFMENYKEPKTQLKLQDAVAEFLLERQRANKRPETIRNLKQRIGSISDNHPDKFVSAVTEQEIKDVVFKPGRGLVAQDNDRRALLGFFNWATKKGYCALNPVKDIDPITIERDEPEALPLAKVRALLNAAASYKEGLMVPYVALGLFAGIRPTELARLTWGNIKLSRKVIILDGKLAKMRERRTVEMEDNLIDWLMPHAPKKTAIKGKNWRRDFDKVKQIAGFGTPTKKHPHLKPWVQDYMRHTAISFHLAKHQHEGKTASWAGNSPNVIQKHYKDLIEDLSEVQEFWSIRPADCNVIDLQGAAVAAK